MLIKASTETLRHQNCMLLLATLRKFGPVSHTEISQWSGLSSATVSAITGELEEKNILVRKEAVPAKGRGRPRVLFTQKADCAYFIIVRITAEKIEYSLVDYAGNLKDRFEISRGKCSVEKFVEDFQDGLLRLLQRSGLDRGDIKIISITSKGLVQRGRAVLLWSPVFGQNKIDFAELLRANWQAKILLTNETKFSASAVADVWDDKAANQGPGKFAVLSLGHSIGLGVAERDGIGRVVSSAPIFGHMIHRPDGPSCICDSNGCIESFAGFNGILRMALGVDNKNAPEKFVPLAEMDKLASKARGGDNMAKYAFREAGKILGLGISRLYDILGPMPVTITGSGMRYFDLMRDEFTENIISNLQVRHESLPEISLVEEESHLVFKGNVQTMLGKLDSDILTGFRPSLHIEIPGINCEA